MVDKFGGATIVDPSMRQPVIRQEGAPEMGTGNAEPFGQEWWRTVPKPSVGKQVGGGVAGILASLLGGGVQNQPIGPATPVDPPMIGSGVASPVPMVGAITSGLSPALNGLMRGDEGGQGSNIQAIMRQLLSGKRPQSRPAS